ncbi:MAG TPA: nucleotidyltransferase family protein [Bacteroidales bacterium]|nr:nucleotidyltransferase family protein [Bacteroidales bacterium]
MKAMILAAGKGTRLIPHTDHKPKALVEINHTTMLEHQINYLTCYGVDEIIINIHHFSDQIKDFIGRKKYKIRIEFSDEQEQLLDTGGGLKKASWFFDDDNPFLLIGIDIFTNLNLHDLLAFHQNHSALATLAVKKRRSTRDFLVDRNQMLCGWKNNLTGEKIITRKYESKLISYGFSVIHVINPDIFKLVTETGAFTMTSLYLRLAEKYRIMVYPHNNDKWFELGRKENLNNPENVRTIAELIKFYQR